MKKLYISILVLLLTCFADASGPLKIVATYPYIASITKIIAGSRARVSALARGDWDPHFITPRPSFIAQARTADLLIANGAQLEIGWLPPILIQSNNAGIQPGKLGFLDLSAYVRLKDIPAGVSRSHGDAHPDGNPHFHLDPDNIPILARAISDRLAKIDPAGSETYRSNLRDFLKKWTGKSIEWKNRLQGLRGKKIIAYHSLFFYFLERIGVRQAGTIEPLPGIPPSSKHLQALIELSREAGIRIIIQDVYHSKDAAEFVARRSKAKVAVLPHDVGAVSGTGDIWLLFDEIATRLSALE